LPASSDRASFDSGAEVEIRQLHEMEDFGPSEAIDRERELAKELTYKTR